MRLRLGGLIALAVAIRLTVVFSSDGVFFDLNSWSLTFHALRDHQFAAYDNLIPGNWPYPPGYLPWIAVAGELSRWIEFFQVVRFGAILADVAIIWLVQDLLGRAGASDGRRLAGAAIVALGPISIGVAGFNGQLDPAATAVALGAYWTWTRPGQRRRGVWAGALLGVAGAIKTVPLLLAWPVAMGARDRREGASVLVAAAAVFAALCLPFLIGSSRFASTITGYQGLPGWGGISLFVQPNFAAHVLAGAGDDIHGSFATLVWLRDNASFVLLPALTLMVAFLAWRRPDALTGICLMYLTVYVFGVNFFVSYLIWLMPFLLVRGHLKTVAALQLGLAPAQLVTFNGPVAVWVAYLAYTAAMAVLWLVGAGTLAGWVRALHRRRVPVAA